jgi:hypothetical protein
MLTALLLDRPVARQGFWKAVLDLEGEALAEAMSPHGRLAGSGLLVIRDHLPKVTSFWSKVLLDTDTPLADLLVEPLEFEQSPGGASSLPTEDRDIVVALLTLDGSVADINVLFHGRSAVDKVNLAHHLIRAANKVPYVLVRYRQPEAEGQKGSAPAACRRRKYRFEVGGIPSRIALKPHSTGELPKG